MDKNKHSYARMHMDMILSKPKAKSYMCEIGTKFITNKQGKIIKVVRP